ncbi:hypothetical protein PINS_up001519 [Pythium insidiosum]|nr:hypothetical protein PINS_up001519 [Pythium insidiosum]
MGSSGCCRGYSARMLFLMGCAMIEYASHTVILVLGPMIALHFYPATSYPRIGFYTALLSGSGYLGSALSCRLWINMARSLKSAKGVILWGLAILGAGFFSLLLCQSLLAMTIVRFAMGLFSGVTPVALIEIDNICGNRQTRLAIATKYLGVLIGASSTFLLVALGDKLFDVRGTAVNEAKDETALYFYPLCFISILSWIAVVVTLVGLRMKSRASYVALNDPNAGSPRKHRMSALDDSPTGSPNFPVSSSLDRVKSAFEETFRRSRNPLKQLLMSPQPHFRTIRSIIPHYYHGYSESGHVVIWDFLGQIKMDRLTSAGFTTVDIRSHYQFFLQFALEKLIKSTNQKLLYIVDLEGLTLMDADDRVIEGAGVIISDLQKSFPDKLYQIAVINAPVWFSQVMAGVKPQIAKKTIDKISFFPSSSTQQNLQELVGVDSLPKRYGGRNGVEFGKSSQERALEDFLRQTTGSLEETKEVISKGTVLRARTGSLRGEDDASDEEAFFDCSEYGLQDVYDEDDEVSIVVHSQAHHNATEVTSRAATAPQKAQGRALPSDKKVHDLEMGASSGGSPRKKPFPDAAGELAIMREPHACLILGVYFCWALAQLSFDEIFPLWFFRKAPSSMSEPMNGTVHAAPDPSTPNISGITMHVAMDMSSMAIAFLCLQLVLCRSSSSSMTPLATLRVGLLFQIPVLCAFPLLDLVHIHSFSLSSATVVLAILLKHITAAIATHGMTVLLDNSIAVDRRLIAHRAAHVVTYIAALISSGASPALFALLGYFGRSFPLDQSLLYFIQALGIASSSCSHFSSQVVSTSRCFSR